MGYRLPEIQVVSLKSLFYRFSGPRIANSQALNSTEVATAHDEFHVAMVKANIAAHVVRIGDTANTLPGNLFIDHAWRHGVLKAAGLVRNGQGSTAQQECTTGQFVGD